MDERMPQEQMIDLVFGYWRTQVVHVVARMGLADQLAARPLSAAGLAERCAATTDGMERLLRAAASMGLLEETDGLYRASVLGATLRSNIAGSLRDYAIAVAAPGHWQPWGALEQAVRRGGPSFDAVFGMDVWTYYEQNREEGEHFARAMGNLSQLAALEVVAQGDFRQARRIVDVGGSQGVLLCALLRAAPQARGVLYDQPTVVAGAQAALEQSGAGDRVDCVGGDFFVEVPAGGDLYLLKQILHDWDDAHCARILGNIARAAAADARLLIVEGVLPERPQASPAFLMDLNMLVMLGGRERTRAQFGALLAASGFVLDEVLSLRGGFCLLSARRAAAKPR